MKTAYMNIRDGVALQAAERQAREEVKLAEASKVQDIDLTGGNKPLSHEDMQKTIEQMAGAIMELTARLDAKGGIR